MGIARTAWLSTHGVWLAAATVLLFVSGYYGFFDARLHKLSFYGALALSISMMRVNDWRALITHPLPAVIVAYIGYQWLSLSWNTGFNLQELSEAIRKGALTIGFLIIIQRLWQQPESLRLFWRGLGWVAGFAILTALIRYSASPPDDTRLYVLGCSENPIQAGALCGIAALVLAGLVLSPGLRRIERIMFVIFWGLSISALLLTQTRGAMLAALIGHGCLFLSPGLLSYKRMRIYIPFLLLGLAVAGGSSSFWVDWSQLLQRADGYRFEIWADALAKWQQSPVFGLGYRTPFQHTLPYGQTIYQPHSLYISALYYGGIAGLCLLLALFGTAWRILWQCHNQPYAAVALAWLGFASVMALTDFDLLLVNSGLEWLLFWLPVASALGIALNHRRDDREESVHHHAPAA